MLKDSTAANVAARTEPKKNLPDPKNEGAGGSNWGKSASLHDEAIKGENSLNDEQGGGRATRKDESVMFEGGIETAASAEAPLLAMSEDALLKRLRSIPEHKRPLVLDIMNIACDMGLRPPAPETDPAEVAAQKAAKQAEAEAKEAQRAEWFQEWEVRRLEIRRGSPALLDAAGSVLTSAYAKGDDELTARYISLPQLHGRANQYEEAANHAIVGAFADTLYGPRFAAQWNEDVFEQAFVVARTYVESHRTVPGAEDAFHALAIAAHKAAKAARKQKAQREKEATASYDLLCSLPEEKQQKAVDLIRGLADANGDLRQLYLSAMQEEVGIRKEMPEGEALDAAIKELDARTAVARSEALKTPS